MTVLIYSCICPRLGDSGTKEGFMVIDCHYHLEERVFTPEELLGRMDACGIDKTALMGSMIEPFREPPRLLVAVLQLLIENPVTRPVARALVSDFTDKGEIRILGRPYPIETDPDNAKVFDTVRRHPRRFLGWVFVNPRGRRDPMAELERYKDDPGFVGVKAHPFWHRYPPLELEPVAARLASMGKPLLIHAGFGDHGDFEALLKRVHGLRLILAHAGFPEYRRTWEKVIRYHDVCLDLSQTSYTSLRATRGAFRALGPERLLFGTDGPYGFHGPDGRYDYGYIKKRIERLFPDTDVRRMILGVNFSRVAGLA